MGNSDEPVYVTKIGPVGRVVLYTLMALMIAIGPVLAVVDIADRDHRWVTVLIGIVLSAFLIPFGVIMSIGVARSARRMRRLREVGIAATAEIISVKDASVGEEVGVALGLRVSGSGFASFETTVKCSSNAALHVGAELPAVVDPTGTAFTINGRLIRAANSF
ncbi:hypothetical protein F0L68_27305 [Solihabitans fulvus]|uniref:Uncharacterized protein n=1 Tax=Solihabitans fulvus TaxID=1892852 RepID=A0A5B2WVB6_9PSEU|nr:hypothetical protein [Solihabitans fulvus]KAA2255903.1 hypothetical protein F0L68_27305 [Solihabitans fulvus]